MVEWKFFKRFYCCHQNLFTCEILLINCTKVHKKGVEQFCSPVQSQVRCMRIKTHWMSEKAALCIWCSLYETDRYCIVRCLIYSFCFVHCSEHMSQCSKPNTRQMVKYALFLFCFLLLLLSQCSCNNVRLIFKHFWLFFLLSPLSFYMIYNVDINFSVSVPFFLHILFVFYYFCLLWLTTSYRLS